MMIQKSRAFDVHWTFLLQLMEGGVLVAGEQVDESRLVQDQVQLACVTIAQALTMFQGI